MRIKLLTLLCSISISLQTASNSRVIVSDIVVQCLLKEMKKKRNRERKTKQR